MRIIFWNTFLRFSFFFACLMIASSTSGQNLSEYLGLLKNGNIMLDQSENQIRASRQDILLAKAALLPSVGADFNYQRDFTKSYLFINDEETAAFFGDRFRTNFNNNITLDIIASQSLYDPSAKATYQLAVLAEEHSRLTHDDFSQGLVNQATQLFWQAIFTRESLKVFEENQRLAEAQWQQMRDLFAEGYASELQVYQTESFYKRTVPQLESAWNTYQILLNELNALANLPLDYPLELEGEISISDSELATYFHADTNLLNNPQLKILRQQLSIADQQIKVSRTAKHPVIKANLGYNLNAQDDGFAFDNRINLLYGQIGIQIPIYTGGATKAQIQKNIINQENIQLEVRQKELTLKKELNNATLNFQNAWQKTKEEKAVIQLNERELEIAEEGIKQGVVTPLELKEIRLGLMGSKLNLLNAYLDLRIARLQIERIIGNQ
ncbi:MAG: TolC family protein [Bacteroidota bacterium]